MENLPVMPTTQQRASGEMEVVDFGRQNHRRVRATFFIEGTERLNVRPSGSQDVNEVLVQRALSHLRPTAILGAPGLLLIDVVRFHGHNLHASNCFKSQTLPKNCREPDCEISGH